MRLVRKSNPFTFDGQIWIIADARIDARVELVSKLNAKGRPARMDRPDVELVPCTPTMYGARKCLQHLADGDFAARHLG